MAVISEVYILNTTLGLLYWVFRASLLFYCGRIVFAGHWWIPSGKVSGFDGILVVSLGKTEKHNKQ